MIEKLRSLSNTLKEIRADLVKESGVLPRALTAGAVLGVSGMAGLGKAKETNAKMNNMDRPNLTGAP